MKDRPIFPSPAVGKKPPDPIFKCRIVRRLDELSLNPDIQRRALSSLKERPIGSMIELGIELGCVQGPSETTHIQRDWFDSLSGWFAGLPPAEPLLREAFIKAGELCLKNGVPLDTYWVRGGSQLEVVLCQSDNQITMLIMAPVGKVPPFEGELREDPDIWIYRCDEKGEVRMQKGVTDAG